MIRINLLPIRQARKRESVKQQLILAAVVLLGAGIGLYLLYNSEANQVAHKKAQIKSTQQQIAQYKKVIGEVEKYKGLEETLNQKLKIIADLIKGKTGPVKVLDHLSQIIPKQVWLTSWKESGGNVSVEGEALGNKYVAQFVTALKESSKPAKVESPGSVAAKAPVAKTPQYFSNIRLVEVEADKDGKFVKFKIVMRVNYAI